jgi:hypothetical protein
LSDDYKLKYHYFCVKLSASDNENKGENLNCFVKKALKSLHFSFIFIQISFLYSQAIIIDHNYTVITSLNPDDINNAKAKLHIAYGHTSHGSQVTDGMEGLVTFANLGGKGLSLPTDIFAWNNGGTGGALDLHDYAMGGHVG